MCKAEVQPSWASHLRVPLVFGLLFWCHCIPLLVPDLILRYIIDLGEDEEQNHQQINNDEIRVPPVIQWLVIGSVYEVWTDVAELDSHVIERCRHRPRSDIIGVLRGPANQDGVAVRIWKKHPCNGVCSPGIWEGSWPKTKRNDAGNSPQGLNHWYQSSLICPFIELGNE